MPSSRPPMSKEHAPAVLPASSTARALKAAHGSSSSLRVENTSTPLRSKARANVGAPPRRKSAATVIVMAPAARSALLMLMARWCRNAETVLISRCGFLGAVLLHFDLKLSRPGAQKSLEAGDDAAPCSPSISALAIIEVMRGDRVSRLLGVLRRFEVDGPDGRRTRQRRPQIAEVEGKRCRIVGLCVAHDLVDDRLVIGLGDQPARALGALVG